MSQTGATAPEEQTLIEELDELVQDILGAVTKPSVTTIIVVVTQIVAFVVSFGIIQTPEANLIINTVTGSVNLAILIAQAIKQFSAHKAVATITQAKLDLIASGWPKVPEPGTARLGRARSS